MKKLFLIPLYILLMFKSVEFIAQPIATYSVPAITPGGFFDVLFDSFGYQYSLANLNISGSSNKPVGGILMDATAASPIISGSCSAGHFVLWFEQGSVFDLNPSAASALCEVYTNISSLINSPISSTGNKVNILCTNVGIAVTTNTNALAVASSYYAPPTNPSNPNPGIVEGMVYKALISGQDPYQTLPIMSLPNANFFHGYVAVSPSSFWSFSINTATLGSTSYDFYSVCLHEALHTLGFRSLINNNGFSSFGQSNNYFGRYDQFLYDYQGNPLMAVTNTQCPTTNIAFSGSLAAIVPSLCTNTGVSNLTTCSVSVQYSSTSTGTNPIKVYTPNCWEDGSSLSHFEDLCSAPASFSSSCGTPNDLYFVMSNATGLGNCYVKRYLKEEEYRVLCDLGYATTGTFSSNAVIAAPSVTSYTYNYGACSPSMTIIGLNDGLLNNVYTYTTTGTSLTISHASILANDSPTTGLSVSCVESVYSNATVTPGASDFTVSAAAGSGLVLLKYVPTIGSQFGTATYVYVYFAPNYSCVNQNTCSMIQNGGFENVNGGSGAIPVLCGTIPNNTFNGPQIDCWGQSVGGVNYYRTNCNSTPGFELGVNTIGTPSNSPISTYNGSLFNTAVVGLSLNIGGSPNNYAGWIETTLTTPLVQNNAYHFSLWASNYQNSVTPYNTLNAPVVISIAMAPSSGVNWSLFSFPQGLDVIAQFTIGVSNNWSLYSQTFTFNPLFFPVNQSRLIIGINKQQQLNLLSTINGTNIPTVTDYFTFIDDISIVPASSPTFAIPNPTICGNQSFTNLAQYASTTGTFSGIGVSNIGGQYHFNNPPTLPNGVYPIVFTYTNPTGCTNTIQQAVLISTISPLVASPASVCIHDALNLNTLLTNTSYIGGGLFEINGVPSTTLAMFSSLGTHTISFTYTAGLLCNNTPNTVFTISIDVGGNCCASNSIPTFTQTSISTTTFINQAVLKIANSFTVQPGVELSLNGYEFIMGNNVKITVAENASLVIGYSHFYTCGNYMWEGIEVRKGGMFHSYSDCLIEDAKMAINASGSGTSTLSTDLNIRYVTFNKNLIDIDISNYTNQTTYPCLISNCVFTCRDLPFNYTIWPQSSTSDLRSVINSTSGLTAPYINVSTYSATTLKAPYSNQKSHIAIKLNNVGLTSNNTYYGIKIGDDSSPNNFNLFDSHNCFVHAVNSNVNLENNVFQNQLNTTINVPVKMHGGVASAGGMLVNSSAIIHSSTNTMKTQLNLSATGVSTSNRFWDCYRAIDGFDTYSFAFTNGLMRSTQSNANTTYAPGNAGITLATNRFEYDIVGNEFTNIANCINIPIAAGSYPPAQSTSTAPSINPIPGILASRILIYGNNFNGGTTANSYINNAIHISNPNYFPWQSVNACTKSYHYGWYADETCSSIDISNNNLSNVYRGIEVNGVTGFHGYILSNTVSVKHDNVFNQSQWGINYRKSLSTANKWGQSNIIENHLMGIGSVSVTNNQSSLLFSEFNIGIASPSITCNNLKDSYNGFVFSGQGVPSTSVIGTRWQGNKMENLYTGMLLTNTAVIGQQGSSYAAMGNEWNGTWTAGASYGIYTQNSTASLSPLVVASSSANDYPPNLDGNIIQNVYSASDINVLNTGYNFNCNEPTQIIEPHPVGVDYNTDEARYIANKSFYEFLFYNDSVLGSNSDYGTFFDNCEGSSIDKFRQIEELLFEQNTADARSLLATISPTNDVEQNYVSYFNIYANALDARNNDEAVAEDDNTNLYNLAQLCPLEQGACVYQARALYNAVNRTVIHYDECGSTSSGRAANTSTKGDINNQDIKEQVWDVDLFPNPAQNQLNIVSKSDLEFLNISISDLTGRIAFTRKIQIKTKLTDMELNLLNGAYLITITNNWNETIIRKLLIAK